MMQASSFYNDGGASKLNTTGSNSLNILLYLATLAGTFLAENWYLVIMVVFGGIHAYAAWRKHKREEKEAEYRQKDRELLLAREDERIKYELELKKKHEQQIRDKLLIAEQERIRNKSHAETRAQLYCEHPEKQRKTLLAIEGDK